MDNEIEKLIQSFAAEIPHRQSEVHQACDDLTRALGAGRLADWNQLEYVTHKFAGSSGTYGFLQLSVVCRHCEELCLDKSFRTLPAAAVLEHLARWRNFFDEQCSLASVRRAPVETPDQITEALAHHRSSVEARRVA